MDTAIDFYARGKEKEVHAGEYTIHSYYPRGKFICPECGEEVFLTHSKYKNYFAHYKKTEKTTECDRRVDGASYESIYERIGLPIYIKETALSKFELFISFRALPNSVLEKADLTPAIVEINGSNRYRVSSERFSSSHSTWIPIDHIESEYNITYLGEQMIITSLNNIWGTFAEGFANYGAIFTLAGNGGRKIHRGDSIALNTEYVWLMPSYKRFPFSSDLGVEASKIGNVVFGNENYFVFKIRIDSNITDSKYKRITTFLLDTFNIHLLEKVPQMTPIWPPVIKCKEGYLYEKNRCYDDLFGYIDSGNINPCVYQYIGANGEPITVNTIKDKVARINLSAERVFINIDRKYISSGMYLEVGSSDYVDVTKSEGIFLNDGRADITCSMVELSNGKVKIESDVELDIIHVTSSSIKILSTGISLFFATIQSGESLILLQNSTIKALLYYQQSKKGDVSEFVGQVEKCILKYPCSYKVKIPEKIRIVLKQIESECPYIKNILLEDYISIPLLRYLEEQSYA